MLTFILTYKKGPILFIKWDYMLMIVLKCFSCYPIFLQVKLNQVLYISFFSEEIKSLDIECSEQP